MMDPLTAIGLASAIVQFVDFSSKLVGGARQIYGSASGAIEADRSLEVIASEMRQCASKLVPPDADAQSQTEDDRALCRLAKECQILSDQLLGLLEKTKARDPKSKLQSSWAAVKTKLHERQKLELQNRLNSCRSQLELQLVFLTSSENKARLNAVIKSSDGHATKLGVIKQHVEELRRGSSVSSFSSEAQAQLRRLLDISEGVYIKVAQQKVLKVLAFPDMYDRFDTVEDAHCRTFEWIFKGAESDSDTETDDDSDNDGDSESDSESDSEISHSTVELERLSDTERREEISQSVVEWLSSGSGIYHISGKLGSGKSTLMKFLCNHKRTRAELQKWAGDRKLIFASFFFWKPGSQMQKSLLGLFQSLLHDTLKECPELIPTVLPDLWQQVTSLPWQTSTDLQLRADAVRIGFSRLLHCRDLYKKHCFCFFIDGLDEYEETHQVDYKAMVEILASWTKTAIDDVKLCVSSREYNVFLNFFDQNKRLRLQDLTNADMENYIRDRLQDINDPEKESLIWTILEKAAGIFLWVTLVIKSIRTRLEDGYQLSAVEEEINSLPGELEMLFEYLWGSIPKSSKKKACWTFAMVNCLATTKRGSIRLRLDLLSYSFLDDYATDQSFAFAPHFSESEISDTTKVEREKVARKRLNRHCQGLLETSVHGDITYTHRSVPEFLESSCQERLEAGLHGFSAENALSTLLLAELRSRTPCKLREREKEALGKLVSGIVVFRKQANLDQPPFTFLESLERAVTKYQQGEGQVLSQHLYYQVWSGESTVGQWGASRASAPLEVITSVFYISAYVGQYDYVGWKIQIDPDMIEGDLKLAMLLCPLHMGAVIHATPEAYQVKKILLRQGISPAAIVHRHGCTLLFEDTSECSIWEHFFLCLITWVPPPEMIKIMGDIVREFLKHGATPNIRISRRSVPPGSNFGEPVNHSEKGSGEEPVISEDISCMPLVLNGEPRSDAQADQEDSVEHDNPEKTTFRIEIRTVNGPGRSGTVGHGLPGRWELLSENKPLYDFIDSHGGEISFAQFVEYCNFENKNEILRLLSDSQMQPKRGKSHSRSGKTAVIERDMMSSTGELDREPRPLSLPVSNLENMAGEKERRTFELKRFWQSQWHPALILFIGIIIAVLTYRLRAKPTTMTTTSS